MPEPVPESREVKWTHIFRFVGKHGEVVGVVALVLNWLLWVLGILPMTITLVLSGAGGVLLLIGIIGHVSVSNSQRLMSLGSLSGHFNPTTAIPPLRESSEAQVPSAEQVKPLFIARKHSVIIAKGTRPLLYVTGPSGTRYVTPIGFAVDMEVVNSSPLATRIQSYTTDVRENGGDWIRIYGLPLGPSRDVYFTQEHNIKTCIKLRFEPQGFNISAEHTIEPGEAVRGWMFFELPPPLQNRPVFDEIRLRIENSQRDVEEIKLPMGWDDNEPGLVTAAGNIGFGPAPDAKLEDLSGFPLRSHVRS